ncbi:hypothetical protein [Thalassoglobus polymorphus]|uniref:Uncharacterized protein n=1 Tax=Thalassoglobus polymorphus TaxID=2527994 RepID=A0A517QGX7_9PLAN|nr:hypothetical protein [Thalassoglobus polymorphus]QDT30865.1 hypothetical protein Mal48_00930 [Thalassoglobus polymorphus]
MSEQLDNPFETPSPKGIRIVQATLRVVVAIQCWGYAAGHLHHGKHFALLEILRKGGKFPDAKIALFEDYTAYFLIACGVISLFRPMWAMLIPLGAFQVGTAIGVILAQKGLLPYLEVMNQAVRMTVPTALLMVDFWPPRVKPTLAFCLSSIKMLRLATATTFFGHGLLVLHQYQAGGEFVEIIGRTARNVFHYPITRGHAQMVLVMIGIAEIALALNLMTSRNRIIAFVMATWGLILAASYTLAYGQDGYDRTLIRIANCGAPLTVLLFWMKAIQEQKPIILPEVEDVG